MRPRGTIKPRWQEEALLPFMARARSGDNWEAIGLDLYPNSRNRQRAGKAASELFRRHAAHGDRLARARAIRANNFNKLPGLSARADRRRRQQGRDDIPVLRELRSPWAGMGNCFR